MAAIFENILGHREQVTAYWGCSCPPGYHRQEHTVNRWTDVIGCGGCQTAWYRNGPPSSREVLVDVTGVSW